MEGKEEDSKLNGSTPQSIFDKLLYLKEHSNFINE
jgi:hypothetical protein